MFTETTIWVRSIQFVRMNEEKEEDTKHENAR